MRRSTSLVALAAAGLIVPGANTVAENGMDIEWGGDFQVSGAVNEWEDAYYAGFAQLTRLSADAQVDEQTSFHGRLNLVNHRWRGDVGDQRDTGRVDDLHAPFSDRENDVVQLDYAYMQLLLGETIVRVGRQIANWNFQLSVSDDRRDRVLVLHPVGEQTTFLAGFDVRQSPTGVPDDGVPGGDPGDDLEEVDRDDDGYMFYAGLTGDIDSWEWGALAGYYYSEGDDYALSDAVIITPYVDGRLEQVDVQAGFHYLGSGDETSAWEQDSYAGLLRAGSDIAPDLYLEGQYIFNLSGSLVRPGVDTYSSLIESSPSHRMTMTRNPQLTLHTADEDHDRHLLATRLTWDVTPDLRTKVAGGWADYQQAEADEDLVFGDLQVHYDVTESTTTWATLGYAASDDLLGYDTTAGSVSVRTDF